MSLRFKCCTKCNETKNIDEFYVYKSGPRKGKRWSHCKSCRVVQLYKWRKNNPKKYAYNNYKGRLKYKYGLKPEEVPRKGFCIICETEDKKLVVDHCHEKGHVRGFICAPCNSLIGHIENKDKMKRVEDYLNGYLTNYPPALTAKQ